MSDLRPESFAHAADEIAGLRRAVAELQTHWPVGTEFDGRDETGALQVTVSADGDVVDVRLDDDWRQRLQPRELARAVNQAAGQASAALAVTWIQSAHPRSVDMSAVHVPVPRPSLEEYRDHFPAPTSLDDLDAKVELAAQARAEYRRFRAAQAEGTPRDRFRSPAGLFEVVRDRTSLVALESDEDRLRFQEARDIAFDIRRSLDEIRARAEQDQERAEREMPAIAEVRERTAVRLAALRSAAGTGENR